MWNRKEETNNTSIESRSVSTDLTPKTKKSCWDRFKRLFEDRGFDLEYEYRDTRKITVSRNIRENQNESVYSIERKISYSNSSMTSDEDDLTEVRNFYDQFTTSPDNADKEDFKKISKNRHRVSMRPSMYLTNIVEEISNSDEDFIMDMSDLEQVSNALLCPRIDEN